MMGTSRALLAAFITMALGGCSSPTSNPSVSAHTPVPSAAAQRVCHAADLGAVVGQAGAASGGQTGARFVFANRSSTSCTLQGIPGIQLLDPAGTVIPTTSTIPSPADSMPVISLAPGHVPPSSLPPAYKDPGANQPRSGEAEMLLGWHYICASRGASAAMIQVRLPGDGGTMLVKVPSELSVTPCAGQLQLYPFATGPV
jgi:hypothetical protein